MAQRTTLPSYDWCSVDPALVGVPSVGPQPPMPTEFVSAANPEIPLVATPAPGAEQDLVPVLNARIRNIAAYWHSGWEFAQPIALLRDGAADRLIAAAGLLPDEFGLAIWDAYREPRLQRDLHDVVYQDVRIPAGFVNPPSANPATPPPHATGGTVDLTLTWRNFPLALGTGFDAFVDAAHADSLERVADLSPAATARDLRRLLRRVMVEVGFVQLDCEWWHFEYGTRLWAAVNGVNPIYGAAHP